MKQYITIFAVLVLVFTSIVVVGHETRAQDPALHTENVVYDRENGVEGYLARPAERGRYPGLILIHE